MKTWIDFVTLLGVIGIPSIFSMTLYCIKKCNTYTKQLIILMKAQKAQMRSQLLKDYEMYMTRKNISDIELRDWENQYKAYHELVGDNGILEDRYQKLLDLKIVN